MAQFLLKFGEYINLLEIFLDIAQTYPKIKQWFKSIKKSEPSAATEGSLWVCLLVIIFIVLIIFTILTIIDSVNDIYIITNIYHINMATD